MNKPTFDQINIICGDLRESLTFYRRLGIEIPDARVWYASTGAHHASAFELSSDGVVDLDLDSTAFAQRWNIGWKGRTDLRGRIVVGFGLPSHSDVDELFRKMTDAGHRGLQGPHDAFWDTRYAIIEDPDGVAVGLMSPSSEDKKSLPPGV